MGDFRKSRIAYSRSKCSLVIIACLTTENPRAWQIHHPVYHNQVPQKYSVMRSLASQSLKNEPISFVTCVRLSVYLQVATREPLKRFSLNLTTGDGITTICRRIIILVQLQRKSTRIWRKQKMQRSISFLGRIWGRSLNTCVP